MLTTAILDRDYLSMAASKDLPPRRDTTAQSAGDADARLHALRKLLEQARGRSIRPRGALSYSMRSA